MLILRPRPLAALVVLVAAAGVCVSGCARRGELAAAPTMRIGVGAPPKGSPRSGARFVVDALTTETWLLMRVDGSQSDRLVSRWEWDEHHTTLRLTLRRDVYFHDGSPLVPEIAVKALRQSVKENTVFSLSSIQSIDASGPNTINVRLAEPNSFLLPDLALTSVRMPDRADIGTGPFEIVSTTDQQTILRAFPKYYRGRPGVAGIDVNKYPTQRNAWAALMRGEIDMLHEVSREAAEFVEAETTVKTYSFPRPYYIPLVFNVRHPILRNKEVRTAINEALDKTTIVRDGMSGRGKPADGPIWPQHWAYSAPTRPFAFDPKGARQRLDNAGFSSKTNSDGTIPARLSFTCLVFADDTRFDRLTVLVQKQLADIGIEMKLLPLTQEQLVKRVSEGNFDAFIFEFAGRSLSWVYEFWRYREGGLNNSGYRAADATLDKIRGARSDDEIRAGVAELERILHDDPPAAFLAWQDTARAVSTSFDVAAEVNRDIFTNTWQWRPVATIKGTAR